ncbi:MAG: putative Ig domain-containing protein, partial [Woeseiaceae bacterium]
GSDSSEPWTGAVESEVTVSGSVGDGPAINSSVRIRSRDGDSLATFVSDSSGSYRVDLKVSDRQFPLLVDASGGIDIVTNSAPDFVMRSAAVSSGKNVTANVNPFSTLAYEAATDMNGGLTSANLLAAEDIVVASANSGLTTLVSQGPMQTRVDGGNAAEIIKASETIAEVIRRTRDALNASGRTSTGNSVMEALGSDLIDGVIEGNGGSRADSRTAAVAIVAAAQVLLEAMVNELHVNGVDVTNDMRMAIDQVVSGPVSPSLDDLSVTAEMIGQARIGLEAAFAVTSDTGISDLIQVLDGVQAGMAPALVRTLMPGSYRDALHSAVAMAAAGDDSVVATINGVARSGGTSGDGNNRAPTISGQPANTVRAGTPYDFSPTASDLDGDSLSFSITARPDWATFDTSTGRLSGTPLATHVGRYDGISITVSDGALTSSVGPFSIEVTTGNSAPTITGTPATTVGVSETYSFTPQASDPDGDTLRFLISGDPNWATFDTLTGRLSGTPNAVHVGVYDGIVITVTDGSSQASLAAFSIEVTDAGAATGSVALNWTPPTENEDGSPLMDLSGYKLYWGRDGGVLGNSVTIDNPSITRFIVDNLTPGSYEFVATAINSAGVES